MLKCLKQIFDNVSVGVEQRSPCNYRYKDLSMSPHQKANDVSTPN